MRFQLVRRYFGDNEWKQFARNIRVDGGLLSSLAHFPDSVLVTGCQRSGTTLVTRLLVQGPDINDIWASKDDEYDAAMILSGNRKIPSTATGRYCFQTTYLNEAYIEYIENKNLPFQIVWVLRNPYSVVNSMLYNWGRYPLNELFKACGEKYMEEYSRHSGFIDNFFPGPKAIEKACLSYIGKQKQMFELIEHFPDDRLLVVNYESITTKPLESVQKIFSFARISYESDYTNMIKTSSKPEEVIKNKKIIEEMCMDTYIQAKKIAKL